MLLPKPRRIATPWMNPLMIGLFAQLARRCSAGERLALCTVIDARGSTPQQRGARMVVGVSG
ncbi:MAG TPA: XdhC family protein, partial [Tepidisphaeraceae bacterium]